VIARLKNVLGVPLLDFPVALPNAQAVTTTFLVIPIKSRQDTAADTPTKSETLPYNVPTVAETLLVL
jgi:hypothetical protein